MMLSKRDARARDDARPVERLELGVSAIRICALQICFRDARYHCYLYTKTGQAKMPNSNGIPQKWTKTFLTEPATKKGIKLRLLRE